VLWCIFSSNWACGIDMRAGGGVQLVYCLPTERWDVRGSQRPLFGLQMHCRGSGIGQACGLLTYQDLRLLQAVCPSCFGNMPCRLLLCTFTGQWADNMHPSNTRYPWTALLWFEISNSLLYDNCSVRPIQKPGLQGQLRHVSDGKQLANEVTRALETSAPGTCMC
jgi:hypothetical protein